MINLQRKIFKVTKVNEAEEIDGVQYNEIFNQGRKYRPH